MNTFETSSDVNRFALSSADEIDHHDAFFCKENTIRKWREDKNNSDRVSTKSEDPAEPPTVEETAEHGLLITLEDGGRICQFSFCEDANFKDIHPNAYGPANLSDLQKLGGGGSGVTIFAGTHPTLGDVVMKHGADKDLKELFALATIAEELKHRGGDGRCTTNASEPKAEANNNDIQKDGLKFSLDKDKNSNKGGEVNNGTTIGYEEEEEQLRRRHESAIYVRERIPEFRFIYISPRHLEIQRRVWFKQIKKMALYNRRSRNLLSMSDNSCCSMDSSGHDTIGNTASIMRPGRKRNNSSNETTTGHIRIYDTSNDPAAQEGDDDSDDSACSIQAHGDSLYFTLRDGFVAEKVVRRDGSTALQVKGDGYTVLKSIVDNLLPIMKENRWKFTFGQKTIGGTSPMTGNAYLYDGRLKGPILDNLLDQYIQAIRHLNTLALQEEKDDDLLERIRGDINKLDLEDISTDQISKEADAFMGNALIKNVDPKKGRFVRLRQLGRQFREKPDSLILTPEEQVPAKHIGELVLPTTLMSDVFVDSPLEPTVMENTVDIWKKLLLMAVQPRRKGASPFALTRMWTCGLTDGGLHNLFLSDSDMWLFDLGEPQLYSPPGFLTKFLFSFFHTLGMEEDETGSTWVNRFNVVENDENKLELTAETKELLAHAYDAFEITLDRIINELFDGDDGLRWLLIWYVIFQLFSDASFCLQKWLIKGGGRSRDKNHQQGIEKWLWRALWDLYVAYHLQSADAFRRLHVEHPTTDRENNEYEYEEEDMEFTTQSSSRRSSFFVGLDEISDVDTVPEEETTTTTEEEEDKGSDCNDSNNAQGGTETQNFRLASLI